MASAAVETSGMTRREFLYYVWGASMALFTAQSVGAIIWFLIPKFREGEFGGVIPLSFDNLPPENEPPFDFPDGRFWLSNVQATDVVQDLATTNNNTMYRLDDEPELTGVVAIYKICTHLGCIYAWVDANSRFECPCHGSKYRLDGRRIESPAPRTLDRFPVQLVDTEGNVVSESSVDENGFYGPAPIPAGVEIASILVNTGALAKGPVDNLVCDYRGNCP